MGGGYNGAWAAAAAAAVAPADPLARFAVYSAVSLAGAAALGLLSMAVESAAFAGYKWLERQGLIERLIPDKEQTVRRRRAAAAATAAAAAARQPAAASIQDQRVHWDVCLQSCGAGSSRWRPAQNDSRH